MKNPMKMATPLILFFSIVLGVSPALVGCSSSNSLKPGTYELTVKAHSKHHGTLGIMYWRIDIIDKSSLRGLFYDLVSINLPYPFTWDKRLEKIERAWNREETRPYEIRDGNLIIDGEVIGKVGVGRIILAENLGKVKGLQAEERGYLVPPTDWELTEVYDPFENIKNKVVPPKD